MNADDLRALDHRGRAAGADLHQAASSRPLPTFTPDAVVAPAPVPLRPHRTGRRLLSAAAVVLALAAVATVVATQGDEDDGTADEVVADQLRGWELGAPPAGLALAGAGEDVRDGAPAVSGTLSAYGPSPDDPQVGVSAMDGWSLNDMGATAKRFTVDGVEVADLAGFGLAPVALVIDDPDSPGDGIVAISATLDREELARLAMATTVTGGVARIDDAALADGWRLLTEDPSGPFLANSTAVARGGMADARSVAYLEVDADEGFPRSMTITSRGGDEDQLQLVRLTADEVEEVEVGGVPALLTTQQLRGEGIDDRVQRAIAWQPRPGELVQITALDVEEQVLLDAAASARPIPEAAWADLVRQTTLGLLGQGGGPVIAEDTLDDGTPFALRFDPDGQTLKLNVAVDDDGEGSSGSATASTDMTEASDGARWLASATTDVAGRTFDAGLVSADVAFVSIRRGDQELVRLDARTLALDELATEALGEQLSASRWYVLERPDGADRAVLIRSDGTEALSVDLAGPMVAETRPGG